MLVTTSVELVSPKIEKPSEYHWNDVAPLEVAVSVSGCSGQAWSCVPVPLVVPLMVGVGGAGVGVTLTTSVAVEVAPSLSTTCKVTLFAPPAAVQSAATVAVTVPVALLMPVTEMPAGMLVAV